MLYEKESPPVSSLPSPRWNTRSQSNRVRTFLVLGIIALFLVTVALIGHYSGVSRVPSSPSLRSLKNPNLLNPLHQQDRFGSVRKPTVKSSEDEYDDDDFVVNDGIPPKQSPAPDSIPPTQNPNEPILANSTLDFGKIYVLNLETREDRRDEMTFIAAASGLQLSFVPGVNSKTLETQSLPDSYAVPGVILEPAHLACYRGHANIWRKIVEEGVQTALILEDDIDWDLTIRESIPRLKEGLAKITGDPDPWRNTPGMHTFILY
jgi:Glycosyltransferase family 25 (LPS biosynthesis protein)